MKAVRLSLYRAFPVPRARRVTVQPFTVGRFYELVERAATKLALVRLRAGREPLEPVLPGVESPTLHDVVMALIREGVVHSLDRSDFAALAALAAPEAPDSWFIPYFNVRNIRKLLGAIGEANEWRKLLSRLRLSGPEEGKGTGGGGSIAADIVYVARLTGVSPVTIRREWAMEDFIDVCEGLKGWPDAQEAAARPQDEPTSLEELGFGIVH